MTSPAPIRLLIDGMSCASCVGRVERALVALDGVRGASVNLATQSAELVLERPAALEGVVAALAELGYPARIGHVTLRVGGMSCGGCVGRAERALATAPGVVTAAVNMATESATVSYLEGAITPAELARAATEAGYPADVSDGGDAPSRADRRAEEAHALRRGALIAAALTLPVFVLEMGGHLVPAFHHWVAGTIGQQTAWVIQFVLATLVLFGPGRVFYAKGIPALMKGAPDMNSLVAVGTGAAWGFSVVATFLPGLLPADVRAVYFEAAAVIVVLILVGRWLEARARGRTGAAIEALLGLQARTARVLRDGVAHDVDIAALRVGDAVLIRPGERIPADGAVTEGGGTVDESMITGEPIPVTKTVGAGLTGGTVNGTGGLTMQVTRVGADTTLAQIIRMVEEAQGAKLPIQGLVDRVTLWFVPAVMGVAALTVALWLALGPAPVLTFALVAGVSVLIIACPCAMGLATPTSIMVGTGRAAEMGVLFRKGDALQALSGVDVIAFDKTGTVTEGKPTLTDLEVADGFGADAVLRWVAAVETRSEHPVADAVLRRARAAGIAVPPVDGFHVVAGTGAGGEVEGRRIAVGSARLMAREGVDVSAFGATAQGLAAQGRTVIYAAVDGRLAAIAGIADPVKPSSAEAIRALHAAGYHVAMITGDKEETARAIAHETGIDDVVADVLPQDKVAALDALRRGGRRVAFVGDGINDAPALAHADVGIAIGTGTDVAIESADVVLMSGDLRGVVNAAAVSQRTMANIRQNLVWAFGYNVALIPVAAGVLYPAFGLLLSPMFAAGAMALSSVSVLSNALRLRRLRPVLGVAPGSPAVTAAQAHAPLMQGEAGAPTETRTERAQPAE